MRVRKHDRSIGDFIETEIDTERILFSGPIHLSIFLFLPDKTDFP